MIDKEIIAVFHYADAGSKCCGREPYRYAEEIVRCKECRYKDMELCAMYKLVVAGVRKPDDFCSHGEREGE